MEQDLQQQQEQIFILADVAAQAQNDEASAQAQNDEESGQEQNDEESAQVKNYDESGQAQNYEAEFVMQPSQIDQLNQIAWLKQQIAQRQWEQYCYYYQQQQYYQQQYYQQYYQQQQYFQQQYQQQMQVQMQQQYITNSAIAQSESNAQQGSLQVPQRKTSRTYAEIVKG